MHWFIDELGALTAAENCCHTLHNTYTLRGASIRDPQAWSQYLNDTIDRWGHKTQVMYGMHHWPVWGAEATLDMLRRGRDAYRYINDQTLRLANQGYTPLEIGETVELPEPLSHNWGLRGYYGTVNHNVKATYVKYLGWFDGNPANLHNLPPEDTAKRYVEFMGGAEAVLELTNGSLNHSLDRLDPNPDVTVTLARTALDRVIGGKTTLPDEAKSGEIKVEPDIAPLQEFLSMLDDFDPWFNIIEP